MNIAWKKYKICVCMCSRDILQSVIDADLSDAAFPFSTHKVYFLLLSHYFLQKQA